MKTVPNSSLDRSVVRKVRGSSPIRAQNPANNERIMTRFYLVFLKALFAKRSINVFKTSQKVIL